MLSSYFVGCCSLFGIKLCEQLVSGHWEHWEQKPLSKFDISKLTWCLTSTETTRLIRDRQFDIKSTWHYKTKPLIWSFILIACTCRSKQILRRLVPLRQKMVLLLISPAPCERKLNESDERLHPASAGKRSASLPICRRRQAVNNDSLCSLSATPLTTVCSFQASANHSYWRNQTCEQRPFSCVSGVLGTTSSAPEELIRKCHKKRKCFQII